MTSPWSAKIPSGHTSSSSSNKRLTRHRQADRQRGKEIPQPVAETETRLGPEPNPFSAVLSASLAYFLNNLAHKSFGAAASLALPHLQRQAAAGRGLQWD